MRHLFRLVCCTVAVVLLSAGGCGDKPRRNSTTPSTSPTSVSATDVSSTATPTPTPTTVTSSSAPPGSPTGTPTGLSQVAVRTGYTVTRDGQPIDRAGLRAIGWTVDAGLGEARWSDPVNGLISVTWELPDERAVGALDSAFWGEVTGQNLAMSPHMYGTVFVGELVEASAYSTGGRRAETPMKRIILTVPPQPPGTAAQVHLNLSWPQPVLVTYDYVYQ